MSELTRNIISRSTIAVVAILLLWGSLTCLRAARQWHAEWRENNPQSYQREHSGAFYPAILGVILLIAGGFAAILAVVPIGWLLIIFPLRNITLHENPNKDNPRGRW